MDCPALILAGGASKRMGRDKATMVVEGVTMIERVAQALKSAGFARILISVRDGYQRQKISGMLSYLSGIEFVIDRNVERGTLPALYSAMKTCKMLEIDEIQLAPCDLPWVVPDVFIRLHNEKMRRLVMPRSSRLEPMLALTDVSSLIEAFDAAPKRSSLRDIMRRVPHQIIPMSDLGALCFQNVNSHKDLIHT